TDDSWAQLHTDFRSKRGGEIVRHITDELRARKEKLHLDDVRSLTAPLGISPAGGYAFTHSQGPPQGKQKMAEEKYNASMGERDRIATRIDFTFSETPFTRQSMDDLGRIEQAIREALPSGWRQGDGETGRHGDRERGRQGDKEIGRRGQSEYHLHVL